jgi:cytochrome c-type biogenesis protein CcmF
MKWSYVELGWGGYWAWDPVENASLLPWLVGTAFLHSAAMQRRTGMLKGWNVGLATLTFEGCIFGTFLTRSGVLSSVHAFAGSSLGPFFVGFMLLSLSAVLSLSAWRADALKGEQRTCGLLSRETAFLLNNWLFSALTFATLWGTTLPLLSGAFMGRQITVSTRYYDRVSTPIGLLLLLLIGICTLLPWRRAHLLAIWRRFLPPLAVGAAAGVAAALLLGVLKPYRVVCIAGVAFVVSAIVAELASGAKVRSRTSGAGVPAALMVTLWRDRRRFGGHLVHLGIASIFIGLLGSSAYEREVQKSVFVGDSVEVGNHVAVLQEVDTTKRLNAELITARLALEKNGVPIGTLTPARAYYPKADSPMTEVSIHSTLLEDVYAIFGGISEDGHVALKLSVKPLVSWIWYGSWLVALGGLVALTDRRRLAG